MHWIHSRRLHVLLAATLVYFLTFAVLRLMFMATFSDVGIARLVDPVVRETLLIGFAFDLRLAILVTLPVALVAFLPVLNVSRAPTLRACVKGWWAIATFIILFIYVIDFGHYAYLGQRINATVLRFLGDPLISAQMMWETYPVVLIFMGHVAVSVLITAILWRVLDRAYQRAPVTVAVGGRVVGAAALTVVTFLGLLGRLENINLQNPVPLRWSDAFFSSNPKIAAVGLNPVIFLYDTLWLPDTPYQREAVEQYFPDIARYLGVDPRGPLSFVRRHGRQPHALNLERPPNIVMIMLESLGASSVSMFGNPLDTTPNLAKIAREGWFFKRFYVPVTGTAKTVWTSFTGIPDVSREETATRNPLITRQLSLVNALEGYTKLYAIGGSAGWANMSSLIRNSVDGITLFEEGDWTSPNADVWGISDLDLFKETHEILKKQPKDRPFFIYIQTASNHRPYTIPENRDDFKVLDMPLEQVQDASFKAQDHYNSVRFLDYNIGRFLEMAREGGYFDNTIFVMFGDHNTRITRIPFMPPAFEQLGLESNHVPALFYAPGLLPPREFDEAVGLADLMPTLMGLLGLSYETGVMGRDILQPAPEGERAIPLVLVEGSFPIIGAVTQKRLVQMGFDGSQPSLHDLDSPTPRDDIADREPQEFERLRRLARGLYEASFMMMYTNVRPAPAVGASTP